jgi:hypothetical protein
MKTLAMEEGGRQWTIIALILLILFNESDFTGRLWNC